MPLHGIDCAAPVVKIPEPTARPEMTAWATRHMMLPIINDEAKTRMLLSTTEDVSKWCRNVDRRVPRGRKVRQLAKEPEGCCCEAAAILMFVEEVTASLDAGIAC